MSWNVKDLDISKDRSGNDTDKSDYLTHLITLIEHAETLNQQFMCELSENDLRRHLSP